MNNRGRINTVVAAILWLVIAFGLALWVAIYFELNKREENPLANIFALVAEHIKVAIEGDYVPGELDGTWENRVEDPTLAEFVEAYRYEILGNDFIWRSVVVGRGDNREIEGSFVVSDDGSSITMKHIYSESRTDVNTYDFQHVDDAITIGDGNTIITGTFIKMGEGGIKGFINTAGDIIRQQWEKLMQFFVKEETNEEDG